jgi:S-adenosylmethionine decarboxylase
MHGLHLTADAYQCRCDARLLADASHLLAQVAPCVQAAGLQAVGTAQHQFADGGGGATVAVLLAESHVCLHTWPEHRSATLDVYVCNYSADHSPRAHALLDAVLALLQPTWCERRSLERGEPPPPKP